MKTKIIKISDNNYNTIYGVGDIFESSIIITMSQELFQKEVENITKDSIMSAVYRRSFMDKNLNIVTIEVPAPMIEKTGELYSIVNSVLIPEYEIVKDENFDLNDYLKKITITVNNDSEKEYEVLKDSEIGREIINLSKLYELSSKTNRELIDSIEI